MNELAYLLRLTQEELKIELYDYLRRKKMNPVFEDGFVYAEAIVYPFFCYFEKRDKFLQISYPKLLKNGQLG